MNCRCCHRNARHLRPCRPPIQPSFLEHPLHRPPRCRNRTRYGCQSDQTPVQHPVGYPRPRRPCGRSSLLHFLESSRRRLRRGYRTGQSCLRHGTCHARSHSLQVTLASIRIAKDRFDLLMSSPSCINNAPPANPAAALKPAYAMPCPPCFFSSLLSS